MMQSPEKVKKFVCALESGDDKLDVKMIEWLTWDKNSSTNREIQSLAKDKKWPELSERLLERLHFGTSGIRGIMKAGFNGINELVIIQTTQGLASYILNNYPDELCRGVAIGFDGRHQSERFATLTATVLLNAKIPVNLFSTTVPTPFLSYCVKVKKCLAGIMITASHNPKEYNGYKVYGANSASIKSPNDETIQCSILNNLEPLASSYDTSVLSNSKILNDPLEEISTAYFNELMSKIPCIYRQLNQFCTVKFVYSAMHGVGHPYVERAMELFNIKNFVAVREQRDPNPDFPTVKFPNPEEGLSCFALAIKLANENDSSVILANDPDADRLAVAERQPDGNWKIFTGNEIGNLLGWWTMRCFQESNPGANLKNCYMLASTVSSKMLKVMANIEGFRFEETLTGFKWMGNRAHELLDCECCNWIFLMAFEESIGYMISDTVFDKDGISAALHVATMVSYLEHYDDKSLADKLQELYFRYGYHSSAQSYFLCDDPAITKKIFYRIRNWGEVQNRYPDSLGKGKYKIKSIRDLTLGTDTSTTDGKSVLPKDENTQMITFTFENEAVITLRTSGTEPKIKYYAEKAGKPGIQDFGAINATVQDMVKVLVDEFLQPKENKLRAQGDDGKEKRLSRVDGKAQDPKTPIR